MGYKLQPEKPRRSGKRRSSGDESASLARAATGARGWVLVASILALVLCTSLSCRVRNLDDSRRAPSGMPSEAINAPAGIASQPPALGGKGARDSASGAPAVPPALVLAPGFGRAGFSAVRQAQREAERLLPGLEHSSEPWGALSRRLNQLLERRWPSSSNANGAAPELLSLDLSRHGQLNLAAVDHGHLLGKALGALDVQEPPAGVSGESLSYDWEAASGPLLVLARSGDGEMGAIWLGHEPATDTQATVFVSSAVTASASLAVMCSCVSPEIVERGAQQLEAVVHDATALHDRVRELGSQLRAAANDDRFGVLVLSSHGVLAASSASLAYGVAGNVGRATLPMTTPPTPPAESSLNDRTPASEPVASDDPLGVRADAGSAATASEPLRTPPDKSQSVPSGGGLPFDDSTGAAASRRSESSSSAARRDEPHLPKARSPEGNLPAPRPPETRASDAAVDGSGRTAPQVNSTGHATSPAAVATQPQKSRTNPEVPVVPMPQREDTPAPATAGSNKHHDAKPRDSQNPNAEDADTEDPGGEATNGKKPNADSTDTKQAAPEGAKP